jgi:hypothetical protein
LTGAPLVRAAYQKLSNAAPSAHLALINGYGA